MFSTLQNHQSVFYRSMCGLSMWKGTTGIQCSVMAGSVPRAVGTEFLLQGWWNLSTDPVSGKCLSWYAAMENSST